MIYLYWPPPQVNGTVAGTISGTLAATEAADTAQFHGVVGVISASLSVTEAADAARLRGSIPVSITGITEQQSWAYDIRNTFFNALTGDNFFSSYTAKKNKMLPIQPAQLPFLGVYMIEELMTPDGDANAGCIRFSHNLRIGFQAIVANNDQDAVEQTIDQAYLRIQTVLFTSPTINNVLQKLLAPEGTNNVENVGFEGIVRGMHRKTFGSAGLNNEIPFGELQYEIGVFFRTEWWPDITDTLNEIDVTVAVNNANVDYGGSNPEVQPITIQYMLNTLRSALVKEDRHGQRDN